jgi:hypothetical protein
MDKSTPTLNAHLLACWKMLNKVIDVCPPDLWVSSDEFDSIWKRVFHVLESIDYWLDDFSEYEFKELFGNFSAEMDIANQTSLSKDEIAKYSKFIDAKINRFFNMMNDAKLSEKSLKHPKATYFDIILCQIRHIQINIGYCNEKFNRRGINSIDWIGYNEEVLSVN